MDKLTILQNKVIHLPKNIKIFLEGPAGTGKTTTGIERLVYLLENGQRGDSALVITPQRALASPYIKALNSRKSIIGGSVTFLTMGGLAQRMVSLFWPLISRQACFAQPDLPPTFLNLETAQYYMAFLVRPLLLEGYFNSIILDRNRLYSQIIDNLNKSAVVRFPYTEIGNRLKAAWSGEPAQLRVYEDTQACATMFRQYCLANNLLDFSLQMEVFINHLWPLEYCQNYLTNTYRHLTVDNIEEDTPAAHDILSAWLNQCSSALIIYDHDAGYRRFLGADPDNAYRIKEICQDCYEFEKSLVARPEIQELQQQLSTHIAHLKPKPCKIDPRLSLVHASHRFFPEMLDWTAAQINILVNEEHIPPGEIAVLSPYLSDSLRFALVNRLETYQIPTRSHRPSRSLRAEPATQCLMTLAALAHPEWKIHPNKLDIAYTLMQAIDGLDLVRAQILSEIVYRIKDGIPALTSFEQITPDMQERITYVIGERYEIIRHWLTAYMNDRGGELDHFIKQLFGEVLSQPGFGFHADYDAGDNTAKLIESIQNFRRVVSSQLDKAGIPLGLEYLSMVQEGVIAALFLHQWENMPEDSVLIAPAYTFLMTNQPVSVQFWLDISSRGWSERLNQPLTHPYVLCRQWDQNRQWSDTDETEANQAVLTNLVSGLLRRCRHKLFVGLSEFSEQGYEQRGPLLRSFQSLLQRLAIEVN